ncbi:histidine kinase [Flavobacteriaceae bacterium R38]|nr:histidine kinase [Flavobacteriaceae bacterium R38]
MRNLLKTLGIAFIIALVIVVINLAFQYFSGETIEFNENTLRVLGYYILYSVVLSLVNGYFFDYLNYTVKWKKYGKYRFLIGFIGSVTITLVTFFLIRAFQEMILEGESYSEFISEERPGTYFIALIITLVVSLFFHAFYFYKALQDSKVKEQKVIAGTASAQFDALKNQLDPHFLFNSLNVLTSLIDEDQKAAQKFTTSLSKVYRYVLEQKNKELVTVDEELEFAKTYVNLLKMRFEDSIVFDFPEKASNAEAKVVPLSLQLLLENAVKHNIVTSNKPLHIKIFENKGNLVVENNLQPKEVVKKSSGVGLRNIQQRYAILTNRKVEINKGQAIFSVQIPMLTKQKNVMEVQQSYIEDKRYQRAKDRVDALKAFYGNLTSYLIVIPVLIFVNYRTSDFPWVIFPALGWGFGLVAHGLEAYGYSPLLGKNWEERKIKELMDNDKSNGYR